MDDDYLRLNVLIDSTDTEIEKAYRKQAKRMHPDKNEGAKEDFQKLQESHDRIVESRKDVLGVDHQMIDNFLPMDFMNMAHSNKMERLNRMNRSTMEYMMDIEEDIKKNCGYFYSESTRLIEIDGKKKMEKTININGIITKEYYEQ